MNEPSGKAGVDPAVLGGLLLTVGGILQGAGASSGRVRITLARMASAYGFESRIAITPRSVVLALQSSDGRTVFNGTGGTDQQGLDFEKVSGISELSWAVAGDSRPLDQLREALDALNQARPYPRPVVLAGAGCAGAAFCFTFGGGAVEMGICFIATVCGLYARQQMHRCRFNQYLCVYGGSAVASIVAGAFLKSALDVKPEIAFATSVLFLVPGVPLINAFTDLLDGNTLNGMVRSVHAVVVSVAIAFGILTALLIYRLPL